MGIGRIIKKSLRIGSTAQPHSSAAVKPKHRSELDIYFTGNFHAKARDWSLTEDHARYVFYEGESVKANMKVARYKGEEIGIYVFHDRDTNQPVVTSIWKRRFSSKSTPLTRR